MFATAWFEPLLFSFSDSPRLVLILVLLVSLLYCFFGYALFRALLVLWAAAAGAVIGGLLVHAFLPLPGGLDALVGGGACAVLLALASWFFYRLIFALGVGAMVMGLLPAIFDSTAVWPWAIGAVLGLVAAIAAFVFLRQIIIFIFGLSGSVKAVMCGALLATGGTDALRRATSGPEGHPWLVGLLAVLALVLAVAGMWSQTRLAGLLRTSLTPKPASASRAAKDDLRPRFSRP